MTTQRPPAPKLRLPQTISAEPSAGGGATAATGSRSGPCHRRRPLARPPPTPPRPGLRGPRARTPPRRRAQGALLGITKAPVRPWPSRPRRARRRFPALQRRPGLGRWGGPRARRCTRRPSPRRLSPARRAAPAMFAAAGAVPCGQKMSGGGSPRPTPRATGAPAAAMLMQKQQCNPRVLRRQRAGAGLPAP